MPVRLIDQLHRRSNDYGALAQEYRAATGERLVEPLVPSSDQHPFQLSLTATVVVPAFNSASTLYACLSALAQSSFNQRYGSRLEVIVVDDGSTDDTWGRLTAMQLPMCIRVMRQRNRGSAAARNAAVAHAGGDVVIFCDSDMLLAPFAIEELMKRHEVLDRVLLVGFRAEVGPNDEMVTDNDPRHWASRPVPYWEDERISSSVVGWPDSICADTADFRDFGHGRDLLLPDGDRLSLPLQVYTALCSVRRNAVVAAGGFDEGFIGRGFEDAYLAARLIAAGHFVIPVYSAAGWHVTHSRANWPEYAPNSLRYRTLLRQPWSDAPRSGWLDRAANQVEGAVRLVCAARPTPSLLDAARAALQTAISDNRFLARQLTTMGDHRGAAEALAGVHEDSSTPEVRLSWARALRRGGQLEEACAVLMEVTRASPTSACAWAELALTLAALGSFQRAHAAILEARQAAPEHSVVRFICEPPLYCHVERASFYRAQGRTALEARHWQALRIAEPSNPRACQRLRQLQLEAKGLQLRPDFVPTKGNPGGGESRLSEPDERPYPAASEPWRRALQIPGCLGPAEAGLLVDVYHEIERTFVLAMPLVVVDARSFCGQTSVLLEFARTRPRGSVRITAIDDPRLLSPIAGQSAREVYDTQVAIHCVADLTLVPEDQSALEPGPVHAVFLNGSSCPVAELSERYRDLVVPGGVLAIYGMERQGDRVALTATLEKAGYAAIDHGTISVYRRARLETPPD